MSIDEMPPGIAGGVKQVIEHMTTGPGSIVLDYKVGDPNVACQVAYHLNLTGTAAWISANPEAYMRACWQALRRERETTS